MSNRRKDASTARVRLEAPAGWTVEPAEASLAFRHEDEEKAARFTVTPAAGAAGEATVRAVAVDAAGKEHASGEQVVAYEHIHERRLIRPAAARVLALDVAVPAGLSVGYVDGAGDEVDSAIRQLGVPLTSLGPTTSPSATSRASRPSSPASAPTRRGPTCGRTTTG